MKLQTRLILNFSTSAGGARQRSGQNNDLCESRGTSIDGLLADLNRLVKADHFLEMVRIFPEPGNDDQLQLHLQQVGRHFDRL